MVRVFTQGRAVYEGPGLTAPRNAYSRTSSKYRSGKICLGRDPSSCSSARSCATTQAARTTDNDDRNDTAGQLPQSFATAQHLTDVEASTSSSTTAARHREGLVGPETPDSVLPDLTNTDAETLPQERVNSRGPSSRPPYADTDVDAPEKEDKDSDEATVAQAMGESFARITRASFSIERKRYLLLKVAFMF